MIGVSDGYRKYCGRYIEQSHNSFEKRLQAAVDNKDDKELKRACQQFEAIMLGMMYKQMKATVVRSDLIQSDPGRDIFESMLDESLTEEASKTGTFGLAESLYKQLGKQNKSAVKADGEKTVEGSRPVDG
jgi:flagellar protein FlgJ